ncbi:hypothetical protein JL720_9898 [Aureococcus anophagefferens]|nr:hypothetical protein JL720_9898 [Aureococcus anophagefferens]
MARACLQPAVACLFADHAGLLQQALKDVIVSRATATPAAARSKKQAFLDITNVAERETKRANTAEKREAATRRREAAATKAKESLERRFDKDVQERVKQRMPELKAEVNLLTKNVFPAEMIEVIAAVAEAIPPQGPREDAPDEPEESFAVFEEPVHESEDQDGGLDVHLLETASGGSEVAARDTARPRTEDLEDGVPLPLRAHGLETPRAHAAALANTTGRRVDKKDIQFDAGRSSWRPFNLSKSGSLVARGYAAGGGASGPDRGRYWTTAARLEYLAAVDRDAVADADVDEDLDLVDAAADADNDDHDDALPLYPP